MSHATKRSNSLPNSQPEPKLPALGVLFQNFLTAMRMRNCSPRTVDHWNQTIGRFIRWAEERGIQSVADITLEHLSAYRRYLFHYRNPRTLQPIKFATQASYLMAVRRWFVWLTKEKWIPLDIGRELELPREEKRLPMDVLTADEVERIFQQPDITTPTGLRDRALLETFYSTGMRRAELIQLQVYDVQMERSIVQIRLGKGKKDRVVPIGQRAKDWLQRYLMVRPQLVAQSNTATLFVSHTGRPLGLTCLSLQVKKYIKRAGLNKRGSCHLLRHTAATLMMENGADLRSLQMFLGHERLTTTQVYTHVSIQRLQQVHERTHPASRESSPEKSSSDGAR